MRGKKRALILGTACLATTMTTLRWIRELQACSLSQLAQTLNRIRAPKMAKGQCQAVVVVDQELWDLQLISLKLQLKSSSRLPLPRRQNRGNLLKLILQLSLYTHLPRPRSCRDLLQLTIRIRFKESKSCKIARVRSVPQLPMSRLPSKIQLLPINPKSKLNLSTLQRCKRVNWSTTLMITKTSTISYLRTTSQWELNKRTPEWDKITTLTLSKPTIQLQTCTHLA